MSDKPARSFNRLFFALSLGALFLTLAINLVVDPLDLFGMPAWQGFNAEKTQYEKYLRMAKPHAVRFLKPRGLILGTSRAENVNPDHPGWHTEARPVYNMAIRSSRILEVLRNLQHAHAQNRLKQVVLFLDDFMFSQTVRYETGFDEERLDLEPGAGINGAWLNDLLMALLSHDALAESAATVLTQDGQAPVLYLANGAQHPNRFQRAVDRTNGHRKLFLDQVGPAEREVKDDDNPPYDDFRALLDFCRAQGIDLHLAINPMHAHRLELHWINGTWNKLENWKRRIVRILEQEAADAHASRPVPLLDFLDYNSITTEAVPPLGDAKTRMNWWWESSHYKTVVGQIMLDQILGSPSARRENLEDFGRPLDSANIEAYLQSIRARHVEYARSHQVDILEIINKRDEVMRKMSGRPR